MERSVLDAPRPAVVTAADMVAGHVTLDISCLDRIYLNGYVAKLNDHPAVRAPCGCSASGCEFPERPFLDQPDRRHPRHGLCYLHPV